MNPISRLAQIQQAKKEKEPEYALLSERGMPRRREFIMQVNSRTFIFHLPIKGKKALSQGFFLQVAVAVKLSLLVPQSLEGLKRNPLK